MSSRATETLLRELARELEPVQPIPKLRSTLIAVVSLWLIAVLVDAWTGGPPPAIAGRNLAFVGVLLGLISASAGATLAALAGAVPGRGDEAKWGRALAVAGLVLAAGVSLWAVAQVEAAASGVPWATNLACIRRATVLGILPALLVCAFLARAWARKPLVAAGLAATGCVALGSVAVHLSCPAGAGLHVLLGHAFAPLVTTAILALPLAGLVVYFRR